MRSALDTQPLLAALGFGGRTRNRMTKIIMTKCQLMCFLPALGIGISKQPNSGINCGGSKDLDEIALATKFGTASALITDLIITRDYIRYSTYEPLTNIGTLRSVKRGAQSSEFGAWRGKTFVSLGSAVPKF